MIVPPENDDAASLAGKYTPNQTGWYSCTLKKRSRSNLLHVWSDMAVQKEDEAGPFNLLPK